MIREVVEVFSYTKNIFNRENCIFVIKGKVNLNDEQISLMKNCILKFENGCICNGSIVGLSTYVDASPYSQIFDKIEILGTWSNPEAYVEWFGAIGDGQTDDSVALNYAFTSCFIKLHLFNKQYVIGSSSQLYSNIGIVIKNCKIIEGEVVNEQGTAIISSPTVKLAVLCGIYDNGISIKDVRFGGSENISTILSTQVNSDDYTFRKCIKLINVRAFTCSDVCIRLVTFLSTLENVSAGLSNVGISISGNEKTQIRGTATLLKQCFVYCTKKTAYEIRLMTYSKLQLCSSDFNNSTSSQKNEFNINSGYAYDIWGADAISIDTCACEMSFNSISINLCQTISVNNFSDWSSIDKTSKEHSTEKQIFLRNVNGIKLENCFMGTKFEGDNVLPTMTIKDSNNVIVKNCLMRKNDGHMTNEFLSQQNCLINNSNVDF